MPAAKSKPSLPEIRSLCDLMREKGVRRLCLGDLELELVERAQPQKLDAETMKAVRESKRQPSREDLLFWGTGEELPSERAAREEREGKAKVPKGMAN